MLASGAINAAAPVRGGTQVTFDLDYSAPDDPSFACAAYDGPALVWLVTACRASDGSYWAVQSWQRSLPYFGTSDISRSGWDIHLSHWRGPLPVITASVSWAWNRWDRLYGSFKYDGKPVFGFRSTSAGSPLDDFGRNLYLDTKDSAYGSGWKREMGLLVHNPTGAYCYSFNPHGYHPAGKGVRYRGTIMGPGVTPDVGFEVQSPGPVDQTMRARANAEIATLRDKLCRPN